MRLAYTLAWWILMPLVGARLWWRGRREPGYRQHVAERFGFYSGIDVIESPVLWIHAVSVGETQATAPLIHALLAAYPASSILLTHMTPTGRQTGAALFSEQSTRVRQCYLPYDTVWMVRRFLKAFKPTIGILIETEVWPNLVAQCKEQRIPVMLANGRLSERSLKRGQRLGNLIRIAAQSLECAGAQTADDAIRLASLGVEPISITGNLKFDVLPPIDRMAIGRAWREALTVYAPKKKVFLCASTREGEEALLINALASIKITALIVIVPRHPQRFDAVAALLDQQGLNWMRRSAWDEGPLRPDVQVLLGDSMGEMFSYYAAADVAFIGGSLLPLGGQNLIEACAVGTPVLVGPNTRNFASATEDAIAAGAALRIEDADSLMVSAQALFDDDAVRGAMSGAALRYASRHRGATARTMQLLQPLIEE